MTEKGESHTDRTGVKTGEVSVFVMFYFKARFCIWLEALFAVGKQSSA